MQEAHRPEATDATDASALAFIQRWAGTTASELSTAQSFVTQLCELLGVAAPHATPDQAYMFERPITFSHGDGSTSAGRIDCYRSGHFVLEAKKLKTGSQTKGFDDALLRARAQAENYARALPSLEGRPPFLLVVDVGNVIEIYSEFTRSGATYTPFPDPRSHRLKLADLARADVRATLRAIWLEPERLNPARASARVTREVAARLADLAKSLEQSGHKPDHVAAFLTRALFSMFAEDVELLPKGSFLGLLQTHRAQPANLQQMLRVLWADMDQGGFSAALATQVLKFNGKLFKEPMADGYSLLLNIEQIDRLIIAAKSKWNEVEPAIFGTLLERALNTTERHALGAHYTPRAYVERLVLPTVVEPLRADWANVQAAALVLAHEAAELEANPVVMTANTRANVRAVDDYEAAVRAKWREARQVVKDFHHSLCNVKVLDPACGSGNFLYVTLEHLKRLEGEVLNQLSDLGESQDVLSLGGETVTPRQLLGIELNERAAALAELVLWIGYLQWHIRTRGNKAVAEPVVHDYGNIAHRDAVLESDEAELAYGRGYGGGHNGEPSGSGELLTRWDGATFKPHPVTGALVPDETAQVPQWNYINPRQAAWPQADFIVGNPPFIGASTMRAALGDGYVQALRSAWKEVPESADFVMYWWSRAAALVAHGQVRRFGLITTNSLRQTFNRRVVQAAMSGESVLPDAFGKPSSGRSAIGKTSLRASAVTGSGVRSASALILWGTQKSVTGSTHATASAVSLVFAIADHPWVDSANGAAVRIAMTVGERAPPDHARETVAAERGSDPDSGRPTRRSAKSKTHPKSKSGSDPVSAADLLPAVVQSEPSAQSTHVGHLFTVTEEKTGEFGEVTVTLVETTGLIHADLSVGVNVTLATPLHANIGLSFPGIEPHGKGFVVTPYEARAIGLGKVAGLDGHIRDYRNGRDLTDSPRGVKVIDLFGLSAAQVRAQFPAVYQWLLERVKPERDQNPRAARRDLWWIFGEPCTKFRQALPPLRRYIATIKTAKHRTFQFLDSSILPDSKLIAVVSDTAFVLGVLSSRLHETWSIATGSTLEDRPTYVKTTCFETFPFPDQDTGLTSELRQHIATLAEQIDVHRKRVLSQLPSSPSAPNQADSLGARQSGAGGADLVSEASMRLPQSPADAPPAGQGASKSTNPGKRTNPVKGKDKDTGQNQTLTLTALYNVLEALHEGRALTAKEKAINEQGLVSVLKDLHDELDAAVLAAYGWGDLATAQQPPQGAPGADGLLARLLALNAKRAAEEKTGEIRWLRPDFQNPAASQSAGGSLLNKELLMHAAQGLQANLALDTPEKPKKPAKPKASPQTAGEAASPATQPWPATLPGQVRAVAELLTAAAVAMPLPAIEASFKGKGHWKRGLPRILETLQALGRARQEGEGWRG